MITYTLAFTYPHTQREYSNFALHIGSSFFHITCIFAYLHTQSRGTAVIKQRDTHTFFLALIHTHVHTHTHTQTHTLTHHTHTVTYTHTHTQHLIRSEERRVGRECRSRFSAYH